MTECVIIHIKTLRDTCNPTPGPQKNLTLSPEVDLVAQARARARALSHNITRPSVNPSQPPALKFLRRPKKVRSNRT